MHKFLTLKLYISLELLIGNKNTFHFQWLSHPTEELFEHNPMIIEQDNLTLILFAPNKLIMSVFF